MLISKPRFPIKELLLYGFLPSRIKVLVYRAKGARIGRGVSIGLGSVIVAEDLEIGNGTTIGFLSIIRGRRVRLGRFVRIGSATIIDTEHIDIDDDAKINEQVFIGGPSLPESSIRIGKRAIVMQMSFLNPTKPLVIGDDTGIGGHCLLFTHGSWQSKLDGYPVTFAPITLENNVWLPWRVFIMPGVTIGEGATIGANSLVTHDVPARSLAAGSPARVLKTSDEYPKKISYEERYDIVFGIILELLRYLEYHAYQVATTKAENWISAIIAETASGRQHVLVYVRDCSSGPQVADLGERSLYLSLQAIPSPVAALLEDRGIMWVDLESRVRSGSTDVGEETVAFLARYGLRFDRND